MLKKYRYFLATNFQKAFYYLIHVYSWTFRLQVENEKPWLDHLQSGGKVLLCCWHQQFFSAVRYFRKYSAHHPALMISKSKDGDVIALIAEKTGWHTVRGSSSKSGAPALKDMIAHLSRWGLAAHILDGPRGPAGEVKPGVIRLARIEGVVVVPFYISADRAWYFKSWDRFMLPKPFARVNLRYGEMLDFATTTGEKEEDLERQRVRLQETMLPGLRICP